MLRVILNSHFPSVDSAARDRPTQRALFARARLKFADYVVYNKREEEKRENEGKVLASLILIRRSFLVVSLYSSVTASSAAISSSATIRRFHFSDDEEGTRIQRRKSYRVLNNKNPRIMLLVYIIQIRERRPEDDSSFTVNGERDLLRSRRLVL